MQHTEKKLREDNGVAPSESTPLVSCDIGNGKVISRKGVQLFPWNWGRKNGISTSSKRSGGDDHRLSTKGSFDVLRPSHLSRAELEHLVDLFAEEDKEEDKTWARRLVESVLQKDKWYFPRKDVEGGPSLSKAWAFYEHMRLPRYLTNTADHVYRLAEPGETAPTALLQPASMPESCFIEFGVGVAEYFEIIKMLCLMFLVCACINIPNMLYYASPVYSGEGGKDHLPLALRTSAICTNKTWVVCKDCSAEHWKWAEEAGTFGTAPDGTVLVQRNGCGGAVLMDGVIDYVTFIFVAIFLSGISLYLHVREARMDEDILTADDYSLAIQNPPPDATDPDEWKEFFSRFAEKQVTLVTIALDNEVMLQKLMQRRIQLDKLRKLLPSSFNINMNDMTIVRAALARLVAARKIANKSYCSKLLEDFLRLTGMLIPAESIVDTIAELTQEITKLQKKKYNVSNVFVTFETEEGQREALSALAPSKLKSLGKSDKGIPPTLLFRGRILKVQRPADPSSIRWMDMSSSQMRTAVMMTINLLITLVVIGIAAYCENSTRRSLGPAYAGPLVSIFNSVIPLVVEVLMSFEKHRSEDSWQASYYAKITLFRWINTAIITKVSTALTSNLDDDSTDVLPSMYAILLSELIVVPALRYVDMSGNIQRHILAPRAITQEEMNLNFLGTPYRLGERFTAMTNVLFVCFFYSSLFPAVFLFGFAILLVQYHTDKFCLVRIWRRSPAIGPYLAKISRRYFFNIALVAFISSSAFAWAQFNYDNLCTRDDSSGRQSETVHNGVQLLNGSVLNVTVYQEDPMYYCSQDIQQFDTTFPFPPTPRIQPEGYKWMTKEQEQVCTVFGWTALASVVAFFAYFMKEIRAFFSSLFHGTYEAAHITKSQRIDFSSNENIVAYIPSISLATLPYPLLACDVDGIDKSLIGWIDPKHSFDEHNLIFDVPFTGVRRPKHGRSEECVTNNFGVRHGGDSSNLRDEKNDGEEEDYDFVRPLFSIVKHYPPEWHRKLQIEREMIGKSLSDAGSNDNRSYLPLC